MVELLIKFLYVLVPLIIVITTTTYFTVSTFEYRSYNYFIEFIELEEQFGTVQKDKYYHAFRCAYFHKWKRYETYHYLDDHGVNRYLDMEDSTLFEKYAVSSK